MNAETLLTEISDRGVEVVVVGERLRVEPGSALTPELTAELRAHKVELLELLSWPTESCDPVRGERLRPFIGKPVETPQGRGQLVAALPEFVTVDLHRLRRRCVFLPCEVRPPAAARGNGETPIGDQRR